MANVIYTSGIPKWSMFIDAATPSGVTLKVALMKSSYTPNKDHDTMADINTHEISDGSYSRQTITNQLETIDDTNDRVKYDGDDVTFPTLTAADAVAGFVVYIDWNPVSPNDSNTQLLVYYDVTDRLPNGTNYEIAWSSNGLVIAQQG